MPNTDLWAGALGLLLIHDETGSGQSAHHAIRLLEQITDYDDVDEELRALCERASQRLVARVGTSGNVGGAAAASVGMATC